MSEQDGRVTRASANHDAIVEAVYSLVRRDHRFPSVQAVAACAGVGERTVYRRFADLDALYQSVNTRLTAEVLAFAMPTPPSGDCLSDLRGSLARRARVFEHIAPFRRAVERAGVSPLVEAWMHAADVVLREALLASLSPYLDEDTTEAIDCLLSFETWDRLRQRQGLSLERALRVLERAALGALAAPLGAPG
jgi:AcrR family transcriptional regulator